MRSTKTYYFKKKEMTERKLLLPAVLTETKTKEPTSNGEMQDDNDSSRPQRTITLELLRKRSEHNECMVSTLEEIALHQEELECIGVTIGRTCGKTLQILLLQNNVISSLVLSEMKYFKVLRYLNLALNNITKIQGLEYCHDLEKLDLTLNFIDFDDLTESLQNMKLLPNLRELYMIGNPCVCRPTTQQSHTTTDPNTIHHVVPLRDDDKASSSSISRKYVISMLPHLEHLDGGDVIKSERIVALQQLPQLSIEMEKLSEQCRIYKEEKANGVCAINTTSADQPLLTDHSRTSRAAASQEVAEQKSQKKQQEQTNQPRYSGDKEWEEDQRVAVQRAAEQEEKGEIRQKNEGKWTFIFDEERKPGHICLDVAIAKHLSTSLIDVDVHPTFITIIIKSKTLRLKLPQEVKSEESKAQRSTVTGHLVVIMPKVGHLLGGSSSTILFDNKSKSVPLKQSIHTRKVLLSQMVEEGLTTTAAVATRSSCGVKIIKPYQTLVDLEGNALVTEISTTRKEESVTIARHADTFSINFDGELGEDDYDSEPPCLF